MTEEKKSKNRWSEERKFNIDKKLESEDRPMDNEMQSGYRENQ